MAAFPMYCDLHRLTELASKPAFTYASAAVLRYGPHPSRRRGGIRAAALDPLFFSTQTHSSLCLLLTGAIYIPQPCSPTSSLLSSPHSSLLPPPSVLRPPTSSLRPSPPPRRATCGPSGRRSSSPGTRPTSSTPPKRLGCSSWASSRATTVMSTSTPVSTWST